MNRLTAVITAALSLIVMAACSSSGSGPGSTPVPPPGDTPTAAVPSPSPAPPPAAPAHLPEPRVTLPEDNASHEVNTEWWYFNGHLLGDDGARYSFHYVFFDVVRDFLPEELLLGQLSLADHQRDTYSLEIRADGKAPEPEQGFLAESEDWRMSGFDGRFDLAGSLENYGLSLTLSAVKPPVLQGGDGVVEFPTVGDSFYYTYPRLRVDGTLVDHGSRKSVTGQAWMDHQWGDFEVTALGWDWYGLQLDDDTEIMFSVVRDSEGVTIRRVGTYSDAGGAFHPLSPDDVAVQPLGTWTSPDTGAAYPSGWLLEVRSLGLSLTLSPVIEQAEFYVPNASVPIYWEGAVDIEGEANGAPIGGLGFVELVGYAELP